jgi:hypothetical protein
MKWLIPTDSTASHNNRMGQLHLPFGCRFFHRSVVHALQRLSYAELGPVWLMKAAPRKRFVFIHS